MFTSSSLPLLATVPRSGTWFLRYAISFLCHLEHGGRIDDRLTGKAVGNPFGPRFDFQRFKGGPLFHVAGSLPDDHLFIGHTTCPGFAHEAAGIEWWPQADFHVRGFDYLHEGFDYGCTPVELAPYPNMAVKVELLEKVARKGRGAPIVLVYRNPIDQVASYLRYCREHSNPAYNTFNGKPLADVSFREYMFGGALASYAKQFISFQVQARKYPRLVRLVPYEHLMARPSAVLSEILVHLGGERRDRPLLPSAVSLARRDHLRAIEGELGRSLDGTQRARGSHMRRGAPPLAIDRTIQNETMLALRRYGVDITLFIWPEADAIRASA